MRGDVDVLRRLHDSDEALNRRAKVLKTILDKRDSRRRMRKERKMLKKGAVAKVQKASVPVDTDRYGTWGVSSAE